VNIELALLGIKIIYGVNKWRSTLPLQLR